MIKNVNEPGYQHYFIDTDGNVYSPNMKIRKQFINKNNGYYQILLQNKAAGLKPKCFYVHRLVGKTFLDNPNNLPQINHKDYNRTNNKLSNLEWVSVSEQSKHKLERIETYKKLIKRLEKDSDTFNKGIENFKKYKNIKSLSLIWNCSEFYAGYIIRKYDISLTRFRMPKYYREVIISEMKDFYQKTPGENIFGKDYREYLINKYKIDITQTQFYGLRAKAVGRRTAKKRS